MLIFLDSRSIAVLVPVVVLAMSATALPERPGPKKEVHALPAAAPGGVPDDWWRGKEALRRRIERAKYFPGDAPREIAAEDVSAPGFEAEEDRAAAREEFVFEEFRNWVRTWRSEGNPPDRRKLREEGIVRAAIRRSHMSQLMRSDPAGALRKALSLGEYASLPPEVRVHVEEPFSAFVTIRAPDSGGDGRRWALRMAGEETWHECALLDRRAGAGEKRMGPAQGIRLDGFAVVRDEVIQVLRREDLDAARDLFRAEPANPDGDRCFASGNPLGPLRATGLSAGSLFVFENERALWEFNRRMGALDSVWGVEIEFSAHFHPHAAGVMAGFDSADAEAGGRASLPAAGRR